MKQLKEIYDHANYKAYLRSRVGEKASRKGLKSSLATAIGCQAGYLSQVLNGDAHLSLEQATLLNTFFAHSKSEAHFFLLLLQKARAGSKNLVDYFNAQINLELDQRQSLSRRMEEKRKVRILPEEAKLTYYSSWQYSAIHIALTIPSLQEPLVLAKYLDLPMSKVNAVLDFLTKYGLAELQGRKVISGSTLLHLKNDSPHIVRHHVNWRTQALTSLDRDNPNDLHYSGVVSLSEKDVRILKEKIMEQVNANIGEIRDSKEESLHVYCVDFFKVGK